MLGPDSNARRAGAALLSVVAAPATAAAVPLAGYLGVVTVAGVVANRRARRRGSPTEPPTTRFAILVPAHDEEGVIGATVSSMVGIDYPAALFSVHVVADNCTDGTAAEARGAGATVHERDAPDDRGKGAALNWLHDELVAGGDPIDAFVVVDADTYVDRGFLAAMDRALGDGAPVAQGFYDVHEAGESAAASLRAAALACRHHLRPLGRNALGASCGLFGNGMVFTSAVLAERRWSGHLTEDLEMQVDLLLDGVPVRYVPDARLHAEMPDALDASVTQHQRWEAGRIQVFRSSMPRLLGGVLRGPRGRRLAALDAAFDVAVPPLSVLVADQVLALAATTGALLLAPGRGRRRRAVINAVTAGALVAHVLAGLRSVDAPASTYRALASAPRLVVWKLGLWLRLVGDDSDVEWTRTARNPTAQTDPGRVA